jgi:hypothetical protein
MNGYENAPATKMLATNCVCCGRALVDAISVEMGIGPECRKENDGGITDETRTEANKIVHGAAVAAGLGRIAEVLAAADKVEALGLTVLAGKMRRRFKNAEDKAEIEIVEINGSYRVITPYRRKDSKAFVAAWRMVPGRRWENGANVVPVASKKVLWTVLKQFFGGKYAKGPKGVFRIPEVEPKSEQLTLEVG